MSRSDFFLGIDLGSSSVKTSLFDSSSGKSVDSCTYPSSEMEIISKANSVRISPKKLRKVANLVRGLNVNKALNSLSHMDEKGASIVLKTLTSAVANADNSEDFNLDMNSVSVKTITVDEGPALKRFRARAQGRANRIKKRTSHLKIVIG